LEWNKIKNHNKEKLNDRNRKNEENYRCHMESRTISNEVKENEMKWGEIGWDEKY